MSPDCPLPVLVTFLLMAAAPLSAATLQSRVEEAVRSLHGTMGVAAKNLATGETVFVNADTPFPTASVIKVAVMVEVFHQIAEGRIRRDDTIPLDETTKVGGSGVLQRLHGGLVLTVGDLLELMITVSDNTATNLLIALVGTGTWTSASSSYGITHTKLLRPTFRDGHPVYVFPDEEKEFGLGVATPREDGASHGADRGGEGRGPRRLGRHDRDPARAGLPHHDPALAAGDGRRRDREQAGLGQRETSGRRPA